MRRAAGEDPAVQRTSRESRWTTRITPSTSAAKAAPSPSSTPRRATATDTRRDVQPRPRWYPWVPTPGERPSTRRPPPSTSPMPVPTRCRCWTRIAATPRRPLAAPSLPRARAGRKQPAAYCHRRPVRNGVRRQRPGQQRLAPFDADLQRHRCGRVVRARIPPALPEPEVQPEAGLKLASARAPLPEVPAQPARAAGQADSNSTCAPTAGSTAATSAGTAASTAPATGPVAASGTVEGMSWSLRRARAVRAGPTPSRTAHSSSTDSAYGLCPGLSESRRTAAASMLVPTGVVAGVVGYPGKATVQRELRARSGTFDVGTAAPSPAVQVVQGVSFFIGALPESACDYPSLELERDLGRECRPSTISDSAPAPPIRSCPSRRARACGISRQPSSRAVLATGSDSAPSRLRARAAPNLPAAGSSRRIPHRPSPTSRTSSRPSTGRAPASQKLRLVEGADQAVMAAANAAAQAHPQISAASVPVVLAGRLHGSERRRGALRDRLPRHPGRRTQDRLCGPRRQHMESDPGHVLR